MWGTPGSYVIYLNLPMQSSSRQLFLEVGEDMVVLRTRPKLFQLDVDLPFLVNCDEAGAQFHRQTKVNYFDDEGMFFLFVFL